MDAKGTVAKDVACVIPCFNAGARVLPVAEGALRHVAHVFVVDDGSTDGCVAPLRALPVEIIALPENRGKGHALLAGFRAALEVPGVEGVCVVDADGQHDPAELPRLCAAFREEKADLVIGSRVFESDHVPWRSRFGNKVTVAVTALLLGRRLPDTQCGFRVISRRYVEDILATVPGGRYETEMEVIVKAVRGGYHIVSVPIATLYEEGNRCSHFRKIHDSVRIYARLIRAALRMR